MAWLPAYRCGQPRDAAEVLGRLGYGAADAALLEYIPELGVLQGGVFGAFELHSLEIGVLIVEAVFVRPALRDRLPRNIALAAIGRVVALDADGVGVELLAVKHGVVIGLFAIIRRNEVAVFGEGVSVEALAFLLSLGHERIGWLAILVDDAFLIIVADEPVGVVGEPGNLLVGDAILEDPAHHLDGQRVEDLLFEVILLAVGAQGLDVAVTGDGSGLDIAAGP